MARYGFCTEGGRCTQSIPVNTRSIAPSQYQINYRVSMCLLPGASSPSPLPKGRLPLRSPVHLPSLALPFTFQKPPTLPLKDPSLSSSANFSVQSSPPAAPLGVHENSQEKLLRIQVPSTNATSKRPRISRWGPGMVLFTETPGD